MKLAEKFGAELLQDILRAYQESGGVEVFMRDEKLLEQALLQLMTPAAEPTRVVIDFAELVPWLNTSQRLSYRRVLPAVEEVASSTKLIAQPVSNSQDSD